MTTRDFSQLEAQIKACVDQCFKKQTGDDVFRKKKR
jgi:hypothetical protein